MKPLNLMSKIAFVFHLIVTVGAWFAPFLISWYWLVPIYAAVVLQFWIFNRCLVNAQHQLSEADDMTFYAQILETLGFKPPRRRLKFLVRQVLYPVLALFSLFWQITLRQAPLWF
jgi:hypothetical protein